MILFAMQVLVFLGQLLCCLVFLSYTYTGIALDTRLLAEPYQQSQIEVSSPAMQNSCKGLLWGRIWGLIFSCQALSRS